MAWPPCLRTIAWTVARPRPDPGTPSVFDPRASSSHTKRDLVGRDARSGVGDLDDHSALLLEAAHLDRGPVGRELHGVRHDVVERDEQQVDIPAHRRQRPRHTRERDTDVGQGTGDRATRARRVTAAPPGRAARPTSAARPATSTGSCSISWESREEILRRSPTSRPMRAACASITATGERWTAPVLPGEPGPEPSARLVDDTEAAAAWIAVSGFFELWSRRVEEPRCAASPPGAQTPPHLTGPGGPPAGAAARGARRSRRPPRQQRQRRERDGEAQTARVARADQHDGDHQPDGRPGRSPTGSAHGEPARRPSAPVHGSRSPAPHLTAEPVSEVRDGLHVPRRPGVVAQHAADLRDAVVDRAGARHEVEAPERLEQAVPGVQLAGGAP